MNSIEISSPSATLRGSSSRAIDIILPGYVEPDENEKNITCLSKCRKWLLPRMISWGTIAFIIYIILKKLNLNVEDVKQASSVLSNGDVTISNATNLAKITQLWDDHHLLAYHIIGLSIFGLLTNQEAILGDQKQSFLCCESVWIKAISYYGSQVLGLATASAGMVAIYYNTSSGMDVTQWFSSHLYSPHAWMGASTILAWMGRHLTGVCLPSYTRLHASLTRTAYMMGLASCVLGFQAKQTTDLLSLSSNTTNVNATNIVNATNVANIVNTINKNSWVMMQSSVASLLIAASGLATAVWLWI